MTQKKIASLELKNKKFIIDDDSIITTPSGRIITRHENNKGSIITYKLNGQTRRLFVADAVYRSNSYAWKNSNTLNPELFQHKNTQISSGRFYFKDTSTTSYLDEFTDASLTERFSGFYENELSEPYTPEHLTDLMTNSPAKNYVRNLTWYEGGLSIPTMIDLIVMYIEGDYIDRLDPTVSANSSKALGKYNANSMRWMNGSNARSCQQYDGINSQDVWRIGQIECSTKNGNHYILPVALIK